MNGPFLTERAMNQLPFRNRTYLPYRTYSSQHLLGSTIFQNHLLRSFVAALFIATRRLTPGRYRIAPAGSLALSATMRVIYRVHRYTTLVRAQAFPARASGFSQGNVFMLNIADLSHRCTANERHTSHFSGRHTQ